MTRRWPTFAVLLSAFALTGAVLHRASRPTAGDRTHSARSQSAQQSAERGSRANARSPANRPGAAAEPVRDLDPFGNPILGKPHIETSPTGAVLYAAELAPGHPDALPGAALPEARTPEPELRTSPDDPPPGHARLDPLQYGYDRMSDMERDVRRGLHIPGDHRVVLWAQERDGRQGVAIQVIPPRELAVEDRR